MALTHKWSIRVDSGATLLTSLVDTITADAEVAFDGSIPASTTQEIDIAFKITEIKSLVILAGAALTVNTNAANAAGGQSFVMAAGSAVFWKNTDTTTNPITVDVTKVYAINAALTAASLKIYVLRDSTP
jgi:hypothetical protein